MKETQEETLEMRCLMCHKWQRRDAELTSLLFALEARMLRIVSDDDGILCWRCNNVHVTQID